MFLLLIVIPCLLFPQFTYCEERGDEQLARAFDAALVSMIQDGTYQEIFDRNDVLGFVQVV